MPFSRRKRPAAGAGHERDSPNGVADGPSLAADPPPADGAPLPGGDESAPRLNTSEEASAPGSNSSEVAPSPALEPAPEDVAPNERAEQPAANGRAGQSRFERIFCNRQFFHLWVSQVVSATGDWVGFLAIAAFAARIGAGNAATAVGFVMIARVAPGFFFGSVGGILVDRWDRRKVMVVCDLGRAATMAALPFVRTVWGLVLASLVLEIFTLMWSPAKEASVPNLVPDRFLTSANSLSLAAAYGTFPVGTALFAFLTKIAQWASSVPGLHSLHHNPEIAGFFFDMVTFLVAAGINATLKIPHEQKRKTADEEGIDWAEAYHEVKEGWQLILQNAVVRGVMIGMAASLIGGGMLVPLGPVFSTEVLQAGSPGFGVLTTALGVGVAVGVGALTVFQKTLPKTRVFELSMVVGGGALMGAAAMSSLGLAFVFVMIVGVCAGSVYVLGFTLLQESVSNELRGRVFAAVYTLVRFCILVAFAAGPFLAQGLNSLSKALLHNNVGVAGFDFSVPGVRWALWLAGLIVLAGWVAVMRTLRQASREQSGDSSPPGDQATASGSAGSLTSGGAAT